MAGMLIAPVPDSKGVAGITKKDIGNKPLENNISRSHRFDWY
jgi:hypothetical protein